jgi:excisionase family DNA binding protein
MTQAISSPLLSTLFTIKEVAGHCKVSERQVRRWIAVKLLQTHQLGRIHRIAANDLALFLSKYRTE